MARTGEDWTCLRCEDQTRAAVSLAAAQSDTSEERQPPTTNPRRSRPGRRRRGARRRAAEGQRPTTDLTVLQWNADGVRSKRTELEKLLEDLKPSIVAIQETKLRACDNFQVRGYNTIRKDRTRGRRDGPITGGGVATLVREGLPYRSMDQQTTAANDETTDALLVEVGDRQRKLKILNTYVPPIRQGTGRDDRTQNFTPDHWPSDPNVLICGDVNGHSRS